MIDKEIKKLHAAKDFATKHGKDEDGFNDIAAGAPDIPEPFVSSMLYEVWEEFEKKYPNTGYVIEKALNNEVYYKVMRDSVKELMKSIPRNELLYLTAEGEWVRCQGEKCWEGHTYRLIPGWQPPEKPKELVGWEYIESLPLETVLKYRGFVVVIGEKCVCFVDSISNAYHYNDDSHPGGAVHEISASNSTIIWPNKQANEIKDMDDIIDKLEEEAEQSNREIEEKDAEIHEQAERIEELEEFISELRDEIAKVYLGKIVLANCTHDEITTDILKSMDEILCKPTTESEE